MFLQIDTYTGQGDLGPQDTREQASANRVSKVKLWKHALHCDKKIASHVEKCEQADLNVMINDMHVTVENHDRRP
jgi:hypothetical protein